jgi:uncharacterized protein (TIGR03435 family)
MIHGTNRAVVRTTFWLAMVCVMVVIPMFAQGPTTPRPSFEVASIKPYADPGSGQRFFGFRGELGGTRINMTGVTVKMLLNYAYAIRDFQIIGGPDWINTERYDIQAKAEAGSIPRPTGLQDPFSVGPMQMRTQSLLENRFQLKLHHESRELPVYELVEVKGGSKLALSEDQTPPQPPKPGDPAPQPPKQGDSPRRGGIGFQRNATGFTLRGAGIQLSIILGVLSQQVGRTIINKSELKPGLYDIQIQWSDNGPSTGPPFPPGLEPPPPPVEPSGASIFTALQEQLGLKVVATKGPVEVLVIDSIQRPSAN